LTKDDGADGADGAGSVAAVVVVVVCSFSMVMVVLLQLPGSGAELDDRERCYLDFPVHHPYDAVPGAYLILPAVAAHW
jgi:hypothetical protein